MKWRMKESYVKGIANHHGPLLCACDGNDVSKVSLEKGRYELAIELRNQRFRVPAVLIWRLGNTKQCVKREHCFGPAESENLRECRSFMRENRESPFSLQLSLGRLSKAVGHNLNVNANGKSDVDHSTVDIVEQGRPEGCGDGGGKGR